MTAQTLKAERRTAVGSASASRLRRQGKVPAVLYGHREETTLLALSAEQVRELVESGHHLVTLEVDGALERALVKEVQFDPWGQEILHLDFARVGLHESVHVSVEVVPHGTPKAVLAGGVLEQPLRSVELECRADAIPDVIRVEVGHLEGGQVLHVRDLPLPEGARMLTDPDTVAFIVQEPRVEEVPAEAAPEAAAEEPEVIRRAPKEEPEGEAKQ